MEADELRAAFTRFFEARGHLALPSASLVPVDPSLLFTVAGMVPFKPWFLGEEEPPAGRVTTIQKCMRAGGKHNDLEAIGSTTRHLTFFEMLGNFSFGDYFKDDAIAFAWELATEVLSFDPERIWVTVHESDDEAATIWRERVGLPAERIQRLGDDNWWQMADVGPCGPCSELHLDRGEEYGPGGGPALGGGERYLEFWNLVFMQYRRDPDGSLHDLPRKNIDTGAGFERILALGQGTDSVFDTGVLRPILAAAERLTGTHYGEGGAADVGLRILADHARAMTFLVADGVLPSNEGRGYVLRRIVRRAVRRGTQLGARDLVTPPLVAATVEVLGAAYPELVSAAGFVSDVLAREEERFRSTLRAGSQLLEAELEAIAGSEPRLAGEVAFRLHDTYGFPVDLTREIAAERGVEVDLAGFEEEMARQRAQSRASGRVEGRRVAEYRAIAEEFGRTEFLGYETEVATATVVGVLPGGPDPEPGAAGPGEVEVFLDRTPFYAEGGGQVGDTGWLESEDTVARVLDTTAPLGGLHRHRVVVERGYLRPGTVVEARVDSARRAAIRRNHTGTHLLHWALREVLGPHVRQQGSLVAPDRLRFDFSHSAPLRPEEIRAVEDLVNRSVLADEPVETEEMARAEAEAAGAIAFFGERYGERVRVVRAGHGSVELCGGTHVHALGMVGPLRIVTEGSIGASTRRIEAVTGEVAIERARREAELLARAAAVLRTEPEEVPSRAEALLEQERAAREALRRVEEQAIRAEAARLAEGPRVVVRRDGLRREELRQLALALRDCPGVEVAVVLGQAAEGGVGVVAAVAPGAEWHAGNLAATAARLVGGGGGRDPEVAVAGGRDPAGLPAAEAAVRAALGLATNEVRGPAG